jgi:hypothetical protein
VARESLGVGMPIPRAFATLRRLSFCAHNDMSWRSNPAGKGVRVPSYRSIPVKKRKWLSLMRLSSRRERAQRPWRV